MQRFIDNLISKTAVGQRLITFPASDYRHPDANHDDSYFPRFLADSLEPQLREILRKEKLIPEKNGETHIVHAGSVMLTHRQNFPKPFWNQFGLTIRSSAMSSNNTEQTVEIFIMFNPCGDMSAEFSKVKDSGGEIQCFEVKMPNTVFHPLNQALRDLRTLVSGAFKGGLPSPIQLQPLARWASGEI